jgi:pimeloyl-ACP methyl ester carboxylesterase
MKKIMFIIIWAITTMTVQGAINDQTYVLVHGAWHGSWAYYKLHALLENSGNRVISINLPGHGIDKTDPGEVTLDDYRDAVVEVLDTIPEQVILVGHSMGGIAISVAAEARPEKISKLVYLAGFMPKNGESMLDLALKDTASLIGPNLIFDFQNNTIDIKRGNISDIFYNRFNSKDIQLSKTLLTPNPLKPIITKLVLTEENYGSIPKYYISTLRDKAVTPYFQYKMYKDLPFNNIFYMCSEHSPFFSQPHHLKRILTRISHSSSMDNIFIKSASETSDIPTQFELNIYNNRPNSICIESNKQMNQCNIKLYSINGYLLDEKSLRPNSQQINFPFWGINDNLIIAVVTIDGETYSRKILLDK